MKKKIKNAIQFVRENCTFGEDDVNHVLYLMDIERRPLRQINEGIAEEINELMNEYGKENELPEFWWTEHLDEDEIFLAL